MAIIMHGMTNGAMHGMMNGSMMHGMSWGMMVVCLVFALLFFAILGCVDNYRKWIIVAAK